MKQLVLCVGYLFLMWNLSCQCSPPINAQKIEHDIAGRTVEVTGLKAEKPNTWTFGKVSETTIILEGSNCRLSEATIVIDIETSASAGITITMASGRLQLSYERVENEWILREVENVSFKIDEVIIGSPPQAEEKRF